MFDNLKEKIEDKIIDLINFSAGGRLIIYKPEENGLSSQMYKDLVVEKRGDYKKTPIFIKIYDKSELSQNSDVTVDDNFYLIFAHFDIVKQDIEDEILVKDKTSKFPMNKKDLGMFLFEKFGK